MNMDVKILDKMPANWIQQYIKRIICHNQVGLPKECKVVLILVNLFIEHISGSNKWNHMIISLGAGRSFMKSQHQFLKGTFSIIPGVDGGKWTFCQWGGFSEIALHIWTLSLCLGKFLTVWVLMRDRASSNYRNGKNPRCWLFRVPAPPPKQQRGTWPTLRWWSKVNRQWRTFFLF